MGALTGHGYDMVYQTRDHGYPLSAIPVRNFRVLLTEIPVKPMSIFTGIADSDIKGTICSCGYPLRLLRSPMYQIHTDASQYSKYSNVQTMDKLPDLP